MHAITDNLTPLESRVISDQWRKKLLLSKWKQSTVQSISASLQATLHWCRLLALHIFQFLSSIIVVVTLNGSSDDGKQQNKWQFTCFKDCNLVKLRAKNSLHRSTCGLLAYGKAKCFLIYQASLYNADIVGEKQEAGGKNLLGAEYLLLNLVLEDSSRADIERKTIERFYQMSIGECESSETISIYRRRKLYKRHSTNWMLDFHVDVRFCISITTLTQSIHIVRVAARKSQIMALLHRH